jgi:hypothetical protein
MIPKVELISLIVSKLKNDQNSFVKYDIEAALDEIENTETDVKLKYKFVLLSNPTNTKISIEGFATIFTSQTELPKYLGLDEKKIPHIVNIIYQEMYPLFFIVSKSMEIPCPAYKLSEVSSIGQETTPSVIEQTKDNSTELVQEQNNPDESQTSPEIQELEPLSEQETIQEPVIKS